MRGSVLFLLACAAPTPPEPITLNVWPPLFLPQPASTRELVILDRPLPSSLTIDGDAYSVGEDGVVSGFALAPGTHALAADGHPFGALRIEERDGPAPTWLSDGEIHASDSAVTLARRASRPCRLLGAQHQGGVLDPSQGDVSIPLAPATSYDWTIVCRDPTGREAPPWHVTFATFPRESLIINELVTDPLFDWNDSGEDKRGAPFDGLVNPTAKASATDEYVELKNTGDIPIDTSQYKLLILDGDRTEVAIGSQQYFGDLTLQPGALLVHRLSPPGKNAAISASISLHDWLGTVRDSVTMDNQRTTSFRNEALSRCHDLWRRTRATPGAENPCEDR